MKRHITDFESKLLKDGWKLIYKTYTGKNSQFVWTYVYEKFVNGHLFNIELDKKRQRTLDIYVKTPFADFLSLEDLQSITESYLELSNHIHELEFGVSLDEKDEMHEIMGEVLKSL